MEIYDALLASQYLLSVVFNSLGMVKERDEAAMRHEATEQRRKKMESVVVEPELDQMFELISRVGSVLSGRL
jgi:anaphase-promoting complex subunit 5